MSFRPSCSASPSARLTTSMRERISATCARTVCVVCFSRYVAPGSSGLFCIHTMVALKRVVLCGGAATAAIISPRLRSTSSSSVRTTDCGAWARARSPSHVLMDRTRVRRPEGSARISSPGRTVPAAIWPAKPRKSWWGRSTRWIGKRKLDGERHSLEQFQKAWPGIPGNARTAMDNVVALKRADRNGDQLGNLQTLRESLKASPMVVEDFLRKIDKVHLVHGGDNDGNAKKSG